MRRRSSLWSPAVQCQEIEYKALHVCLQGIVLPANQEFGDASRTDAVDPFEILLKHRKCLTGATILGVRAKSANNVGGPCAQVAEYVIEVVDVLVFAPASESQRLQDHECCRSRHPDVSRSRFAVARLAVEAYALPINERKV